VIQKNTLKFLEELMWNNKKEWFDKHKSEYGLVKNDLRAVTGRMIEKVSEFDADIAGAGLDTKKCMTRINRDLRFSKDRTPYKTDFYIVLNRGGKNSAAAFYYLHIQPDNSFAGGGVYNPQPGPLNLIRTAIDADFESWKKVIGNSRFKRIFPSGIHSPSVLSKVPKGFEQSSPAADFLKMKGFYTMEQLSDKEIVSGEAFGKVTACFKAAKPLIDFINQAIYQPAKS